MKSLRDRIVVTGIGVISPLGSDPQTFLRNVVRPQPVLHDGQADFSGGIEDFGNVSPPTKRSIRKSLKLMNRETQLGVAAAQRAIEASEILQGPYDHDRIGVCFGAGNVEILSDDFVRGVDACREECGGFDPANWGELGISHVDPLWILRVLPNMPACHTAIVNQLCGPNNTITQADVATHMAINDARFAILDGDADAMVVGGTGARIGQPTSPSNESMSRPAEAAAAFILERMDMAIDRGAYFFGEVLAAASATTIESDHRANPEQAAANCLALANAQLDVAAAAIELDCQSRIGDAGAGTTALELAAILLDGRSGFHASVMSNGLSSCVVIGEVDADRKAA